MAFVTRRSLLEKVRDGDEISWEEFYKTYSPLIRVCGRDFSLRDHEIEELVQQVMCEIFQKDILAKFDFDHIPDNVVFKYDPAKGRFRHFLRGIIRYQALRIIRKRTVTVDPETQPDLPDEQEMERQWDAEWKQHVQAMAFEELKKRVRPETYMAFEMYAVQNRPPKEVAKFLNLSENSVYVARSRCIKTLSEIVKQLEDV